MSIEAFLLQFEGIDQAKFDSALNDADHLLGVLKAEMPRIERLLANVRAMVEEYEAKQRQFR